MVRLPPRSRDDVERGALSAATRRGALFSDRARRVVRALADLFLPVLCACCERVLDTREPGIVCGRCWSRLRLLSSPRCERCGHPTGKHACRWCAGLPPYVRAARSVCWATIGTGQRIVHALKYEGWWKVADGMAARMARLDWPRDVVDERAALVPVPLAASRRRQRGYNQSECLARALAPLWGVPVRPDVLERARDTETQTRLSPEDRVRNVLGAFRTRSAARDSLRGAHVVLVDDVVTTAATLNACAAALRDTGVRIISYVTFGRAPAIGDRP
jgi:ComF family protein